MQNITNTKHKRLIVVLVLTFFSSLLFIASGQEDQTKVRDPDPILISPDPHKSDGGGGIPLANFNLTITSEDKSPFRDDNVNLVITFKNNEKNKKLKINYIDLELDHVYNTSTKEKRIQIPKFEIEKNGSLSRVYSVYIPKNTKLYQKNFIKEREIDKTIHIKNHKINRDYINYMDEVIIQNNLPTINSALVTFNLPNIIRLNNSDNTTLYLIGNSLKNIEASFVISGWDAEDEGNIYYRASLCTNNSSENISDFSPAGNFSESIKEIKIGEKYSLDIFVKDQNNDTNITKALICNNGKYYNYFYIPDANYYQDIAIIIAVIITILITIGIYFRLHKCTKPILTTNRAVFAISIIWLIYIILLKVSPQKFGFYEPIFFNTIPFFELVIYLSIFIILNYFIELCFSLDDEKDLISIALWLNYLLTALILLIFIFIFSKIDVNFDVLSPYYITIAGILGTVFALIVTLSSQFPKNIFTFPSACANTNQCAQCADPKCDFFSYPKKVQYFVVFYGITLGISIMGMVIGSDIKFDTLIMEPMSGDLMNLLSLSLFEITFLLIPPTIISLYMLMHVISFRGKITIKSRPCGAEIYLSKRFDENPPEEEQPFPIKLLTPCTLMLMNGRYKLKLKYNDCEMSDIIVVRNGEENTYLFELINIDNEYGLSEITEGSKKLKC